MENNKTKNINELLKKAKGISILYAEDETNLREKTVSFLKKIFEHVDVAQDGREALDFYMNNKYDIVITDIQMPNMGGLELISHIRKINEQQEVIINSAYTQAEFRDEADKYNVADYIRKPIRINEIVKILSDYIDKIKLFSSAENHWNYRYYFNKSVVIAILMTMQGYKIVVTLIIFHNSLLAIVIINSIIR